MEQNDNAQIRNEFSHLNCPATFRHAFLRLESGYSLKKDTQDSDLFFMQG